MMNEHEFALFYSELSCELEKDQTTLRIDNKEIVHRVNHILRLNPEDRLVLFDKEIHVQAKITSINKKELNFIIISCEQNKVLAPHIIIQLGLLKRDALEDAIESLTVLGVNEVQLFISERVNRKWGGEKELERLERLMIAAAEQSKQFVLPQLHTPISFDLALKTNSDQAVFCDPVGNSFLEFVVEHKNLSSIKILIGPEGDLAENEKEILKKENYQFCRLTPTILRAELAATLAVGIIRSI